MPTVGLGGGCLVYKMYDWYHVFILAWKIPLTKISDEDRKSYFIDDKNCHCKKSRETLPVYVYTISKSLEQYMCVWQLYVVWYAINVAAVNTLHQSQ